MITLFNEVSVNAKQEKLFEALSTSNGLKGWYARTVKGKVATGGGFFVSSAQHESYSWEVLEIEVGTLIHWKCLSGPNEASGTTVTFTIAVTPENYSIVHCEHEGHPDPGWTTPFWNATWVIWLDHLKTFAETGEANPAMA